MNPCHHPTSFLQAGCPSCRPTNSVKTLKAQALNAQKHSDTFSAGKTAPLPMPVGAHVYSTEQA